MTTTVITRGSDDGREVLSSLPAQASLDDVSAQETLMRILPAGFFRRASVAECSPEAEKPEQPAPDDFEQIPADPSVAETRMRRELAERCTQITAAMDSLLPFVYEDHRAENQALFASTLARQLPLEDAIWGRVAFVLGAYGNYMYRYTLNVEQKRQVWQAVLWAVYYERCYRRKYLAQRCQQLLHFFQGCAEDQTFLALALRDLEALCPYLETSSLKKLQEALFALPDPPAALLQRVSEQMVVAEARKQERQVNLQTQVVQKNKKTAAGKVDAGQKRSGKTAGKAASPVAERGKHGLSASNESQSPRTPAPLKPPASEIAPAIRNLLSFFSDEQCEDFFASLRTARLETINSLLQDVREPLLAALRQELLTAGALEYQAPRRPIRLGKKFADRFAEARRLLTSSRPGDQQAGLRLFEQGARETTHPDYIQLAREWMLYARAIAQGSPRVADSWERNFQHSETSWEERWNLALFYHQTAYPAEALRVLRPGLDALSAPVMHLRLALVCALDLLPESESADSSAQTFLLAHLERWPHPLSCLAWLAVAYKMHGPLHPRQQAQRLSTFQELLEHPLLLPDPQKDLSETRVDALAEALVEKARCDEAWFLWIHDYAERHARKYQAWTRLAETSERLGRLEMAEMALQHVVEIQYHNDYSHYQEGEPLPRARYLRENLEKLFEFYQRHHMVVQGAEAFESCYASLNHLWEAHDPANHHLIALTRQYLEKRQRTEKEAEQARHEVNLHELSKTVTVPLEHFKPGLRVGIFVDYENIARFIPRETDVEAVGRALVSYAAQFGEIVCQWASASPQNISNLADVRLGLEAAQFQVRFPRRELQFSPSKKNLADFALLECLSEARVSDRPDVYLIVSGDRDYYERICSLLETGHTVRILAAADSQHLSSRYRELEQQRVRERQAAGHETSDFFIDNLEEILYPLVSLN
jgi:hypothetical protein